MLGRPLVALVLALVLLAAPGIGAVLALYPPGHVSLPTRVGLVLVLGSCVAGLVAFPLAILHVLVPVTFFPGVAAVTLLLWWTGLRRASLGEHRRAIAAEVRADPWTLGAGFLVVVGVALLRLTFDPVMHFGFSSSWRYWADAVEIADAHRVPAQVLQYGVLLRPSVNKVFLNTLSAGLSYATGTEPLPAMGAMLWIGSVGLVLSLWAVGRELGLRMTAALLPLLLVANRLFLNTELTGDLNTYKAEIFGRMLAFGALAMAIIVLRERRAWVEVVAAGAVFALACDVHVVPVMIAAAMFAWYALARLVLDRERRAVLIRAVAMAGVGLAVAAAVLVLPHGDLGFRGPGKNETYSQFAPGFDPTRYLNGGVLPGAEAERNWYLSPGASLRDYVASATGLTGGSPSRVRHAIRVAAPFLLVLAAVMVLFVLPRDLAPSAVVSVGLAGAIVAATTFFSTRYRLYVPARFGVRRLFDYSSIPLVLIALAILEGILSWRGRSGPGRRPTARSAQALAAGLVVLVAAVLLPTARPSAERVAIDRSLVAPFDLLRANVPCGARILADMHTEGVFEALTGRVAVLEGVTPYLRPDILTPIVRQLLDARAFFHDPAAGEQFLRSLSIDYVVLFKSGAVGYREPIGHADAAAIASAPFLHLVHESPAMAIYQVSWLSPVDRYVGPPGVPGYDCRRSAITGA